MTQSPGGAFTVLLVQTGAGCFMAGLIWTMQILNYPLLALVGTDDAPRYEQAHNRRFIRLVGPGVAVTLVSALIMMAWRPHGVPVAIPVAGLSLLAVIIYSTVRHGAPLHARLAQQFDPTAHRLLVHTNWIRTAAWSSFGVLDLIAIALAYRG